MPSDKAFQVEGKDHKSSDDPRMGQTNDPDHDPKEMAEGNNPEPGSKPGVESHPGQDAAPVKGHLKLAKFIGRMEHKRSLKGAPAGMDKAEKTGHEKGVHTPSFSRYEKDKGQSEAGDKTRQVSTRGHAPGLKAKGMASVKTAHKKVLGEMKAQPKPKLPR